MRRTTLHRFPRVKQSSKFQQRWASDGWLFSGANAGTDRFVEHPRGNAVRPVVRKPDINLVPFTPGASQHFDLLAEQRMKRVEKF
jgi:hypothetical protein